MQKLSFDPARQPRTREEFAADRLREAIFRGELEPGERLDEHALAELWGISRTPVRSAIRILAAESLIELHPHRGAVVNELSPNELGEVYLVRGLLEGMAARLASRPAIDCRELRHLPPGVEQVQAGRAQPHRAAVAKGGGVVGPAQQGLLVDELGRLVGRRRHRGHPEDQSECKSCHVVPLRMH